MNDSPEFQKPASKTDRPSGKGDEVSDGARRTRILVVYYSQSGDVTRAAESFVAALDLPGVEVVWERLRPLVEYPSPWRNVYKFFNVFPECVTGNPPPIEPPAFDADAHFDLVLIAYQVWFLSPSLPVQAFFQSAHAKVLNQTKVITLSVSRNMWQSASETMKQMIAQVGGIHIDNVVITHQGPAWATFLTTTRALLFGKKDRLWGIFPPAGIRDEDFQGLRRFGAAIARQLDKLRDPAAGSLLKGMGAVEINRRYVIPELIGWHVFHVWARSIRALGRLGRPLRAVGVCCFMLFLVCAVVVGIPLVMITRILLSPLLRARLRAYITRLQQPSGGLEPT